MNALALDPVVPVVPPGLAAAPFWIQPSTVMVLALADDRGWLCGSADGSPPAEGGATRCVGCDGGACVPACAASEAHNNVASVLARKILLMRLSSMEITNVEAPSKLNAILIASLRGSGVDG
jgi:hypothetical protein